MVGCFRPTSRAVRSSQAFALAARLASCLRSIHAASGSHLGGVHFELTGEDVTECVGGARGLSEADLGTAYRSLVDPRLNYEQAMEMALLMARRMRANAAPG